MAYDYQPIQRSQEPIPAAQSRDWSHGCGTVLCAGNAWRIEDMPSSKTRGACQHLVDHYLSLYTPSECSHCAQLLPVPIAKHLCRLKRGPNSQCKGKLACHFSVIGTQ